MVTTFQHARLNPGFFALNSCRRQADLLDTSLPSEDLRQTGQTGFFLCAKQSYESENPKNLSSDKS